MNLSEIVNKLEIITDAFIDIKENPKEYNDDDLRNKAKFLFIRLFIEV